MQIGSTELLVILIVLIIAYGFYRARLISPTHAAPRRSQHGANDPAGAGNPDHAGTESTGSQAARAKDPYVVLNIPRNATQDEISTAYRKLAQMYHPDKVAGLAPEYYEIAETKMKDINAAYEQLRQKPGGRR